MVDVSTTDTDGLSRNFKVQLTFFTIAGNHPLSKGWLRSL